MLKLTGLSTDQVLESRKLHGMNVLTPAKRDPWWKLLLEKFDDPIIRILLIAVFISLAVGVVHGEYTEAVGILAAVILATVMAFVNEYKAGKEFDILNTVNDDVPFNVIRDGKYVSIPKKDIVVGDIVLLEIGEEVPADGSLVEAVSLQIDESSITGESVPASKFAEGDPECEKRMKSTAYKPYHVYRGTMVQDGHGILHVSAVGDATEIGRTAREASEKSEEETPLSRQLEGLSKVIGVVGFGIAGLLFVALSIRAICTGEIAMEAQQWVFTAILFVSVVIALVRVWLPIVYDYYDVRNKPRERPAWLEEEGLCAWAKTLLCGAGFFAVAWGISRFTGLVPAEFGSSISYEAGSKFLQFFMIAITIIVVAVPEGLAMSVTLSLAYSMRKMTATNNLVRKMHACETIGAATVICTDKTGTLTMNKMKVYEPRFPVTQKVQALVAEAMAVNSTANLSKGSDGAVEALGNPTECALLLWLHDQKRDYQALRDASPIVQQLTFSTERKFMATLVRSNGDILRLHSKGAPEILLDRCTTCLTETGVQTLAARDRAKILSTIRTFQARGMRALGFCFKELSAVASDLDKATHNMVWLGFTAISDPVRDEVPGAIADCNAAGINVKIVTGDNQETASEIGRQIGLLKRSNSPYSVMTGAAFDALPEDELQVAVKDLCVLSRARPSHKLKLVKTLQKVGEVVAVTGDGTNDAPALNHANVGLSMGRNGTAVAKEASDIILLDDSFRSIANAIMWGRSLYQNIQRFILFQLTVNVAALCIALIGPFIGVALPLTVTQMLWVNLIMDTLGALALATEPPHAEVMKNKPRDAKAFIVTKAMLKSILGYGALFIVVLLVMLLHMRNAGVSDYELTVFFSVFVMLQFWNLFNARCLGLKQSAFKGMFANKGFVIIAAFILIGQVLMVQFGGHFFRTVPLSLYDWVLIIAGTSPVLWFGEILRLYQR